MGNHLELLPHHIMKTAFMTKNCADADVTINCILKRQSLNKCNKMCFCVIGAGD